MLVVGLTPFERPDARLVRALVRAGRPAFLDLGRDDGARRRALTALRGLTFGVRVPDGVAIGDLPDTVDQVIVTAGSDLQGLGDRRLLVEVRTADDIAWAIAHDAAALVGVGHEAGGLVGPESSFVLAQRLARTGRPFWIRGGIGPHTAAACAVAGAEAVVVDSALALARESDLPAPLRRAISGMDGGETRTLGGRRVYTRPDLGHDALEGTDAEGITARLGDDLHRDLVPVGQGAAVAADLARAHVGAAGIVGAIEAAVEGHLADAASASPLAADAPLAAAHGTRWPVVQGPMTRVSDTPDFADAVATAGGLPFVALSMLTGPKSRALLDATAAQLGDRPWGVGILGFVPPEIRTPQLEAIRAVRPPVALIAGGRPSQARELEELGIATWLHAPSPGLTRGFLAEGARRFVFEGRECGGHVGPRTSFVLWQQQLDVLAAHPKPEELHVLFAGGIHDDLSAAMVGALAGPLAAAGAKVGVLMGTAYLFTEEAVASGAILQEFQDAALQAHDTALLETAPGHATRCARTPFVDQFEAEKVRLRTEGVPSKDAWKQLESLNVGRLRVASKGVERVGAELVTVDADRRREAGMIMLGEVAALRDAPTTMAALHEQVCAGATERLEGATRTLPEPHEAPAPCDIAIVGMAAVLPDAPDVDTFWQHVLEGHDAVTEVPADRWRVEAYFDPDGVPGRTTPSKWGGFVPEIRFDPTRFGIPPRSLASIDPAQLLALHVAQKALDDAGYGTRPFPRERTSVVFGTESGSELGGAYAFRAAWPQLLGEMPAVLDEALPTLSEDSFPGVLGNVLAGRIANRLDLGGVNYTVDAACASSLAALDVAVKELVGGTSDVVLCGGADLHNGIQDYLLFSSTHALSRSGRCRTFDANADGIALGEGVAAVVLKRLEDAERDGDRIYAVVRGIAGSSDGKSLGLTAPRKEGQKRAVTRAWAHAGLDPADARLVEAHGTGTVVGDRTEIGTLSETITAAPGQVTLGSVKSQIGHTKCAAGLASLIKTSLALYHGVRPPTSLMQTPNPAWTADDSPFHFTEAPLPWAAERRIAGVSAFGFGGTNFHAVLTAHDPVPERPRARRAELVLLRGDDATVDRTLDALAARLADPEPAPLPALAEAACAQGTGPVRVAIVARTRADLAEAIPAARARRAVPQRVWLADALEGDVALCFPGQGSQRPGMLRDLFVAFPELQRLLASEPELAATMHPPRAFDDATRKAQQAALTDTRVAQPALGVADLAVATWLDGLGVAPSMAIGHSYGEVAALCWSGAIDEADLVTLSRARAAAILDAAPADPGGMVAVKAPRDLVEGAIAGLDVVVANHNAPKQVVISGPHEALDEALARFEATDVPARRIPVAAAFHSPLVAGAVDRFRDALADVPLRTPAVPVWRNETATPHGDDVREALATQVGAPVRFVEAIEAMYAAGARVFVEAGPGRVLTGLVGRILGDRPHRVVAFEGGDAQGEAGLLGGLAQLATAGVELDVHALFAGRELPLVDLFKTPKASPTTWLVDGHRARPEHGDMPAGGLVPIRTPLPLPTGGAPAQADPDSAMLAFLDNMRALADAQRDAMLAYLGAAEIERAPRIVRPAAPAQAIAAPVEVVEVPAAAAAPAPVAPADLLTVLTGIVSDLTGYPAEMLDPDADLEADLSIDSIKRIEVLTSLGDHLGGAGELDDDAVEVLATKTTLSAMVTWLEGRLGGDAPSADVVDAVEVDAAPAVDATVRRFRLTAAPAPATPLAPAGRIRIVDPDGARGLALAEAFRGKGLDADLADDAVGPDDLLVQLDGAGPTAAFPALRAALESGARTVVGLHQSAGLDGLYRTAAREYPDRTVRLVGVDATTDTSDEVVDLLTQELGVAGGPSVVRWRDGVRETLVVEPAPFTAEARPLPIDGDSVVLLTGGARGITARIARALATEAPGTFVLVGRTPLDTTPEPADLADAGDATALRKALVARGGLTPAEIEPTVRRILRARELRATLDDLRATGATVDYRSLDVRDSDALTALVDDLYATYGRLDGVVHGAGVLEDKLMRDKTPESFARVYETKVMAARVLAEAVRPDVRFVVFFGSISGVLGNRGQSDYAAANATLDALAADLATRIEGRAVTIDWGPWGGAGMVSPELARAYDKRGIPLIDLDEGVNAFLDELRRGESTDTQVIWQAGDPLRFADDTHA